MKHTVGVIGPVDLVPQIAAVVDAEGALVAKQLPYRLEHEAIDLVRQHRDEVSAWVFTGVVPYVYCRVAGILDLPATFVDYSGSVFFQGIIQAITRVPDVQGLSIDTLRDDQVADAMASVGLEHIEVRSRPFQLGQSSEDVVAFHEQNLAGDSKNWVVLTCISSVHSQLIAAPDASGSVQSRTDDCDSRQIGPPKVIRLAPSKHSAVIAVRQIYRSLESSLQVETEPVVAAVHLPEDADEPVVLSYFQNLTRSGGVDVRTDDGECLIFSTMGPFKDLTDNLTSAPLEWQLAVQQHRVLVGFGVGKTTREAVQLARRAQTKAKDFPGVIVLEMRNNQHFVLSAAGTADSGQEARNAGAGPISRTQFRPNQAMIALRANLPRETIEGILANSSELLGVLVTADRLAQVLGVSERTARRVLSRLEASGFARHVQDEQRTEAGRPKRMYQIEFSGQ